MFEFLRVTSSRVRSWFSIRRIDADFDAEMASHLDLLTRDNIRHGCA
jgi:hypothetical protein